MGVVTERLAPGQRAKRTQQPERLRARGTPHRRPISA
jgi:hypothetical protein